MREINRPGLKIGLAILAVLLLIVFAIAWAKSSNDSTIDNVDQESSQTTTDDDASDESTVDVEDTDNSSVTSDDTDEDASTENTEPAAEPDSQDFSYIDVEQVSLKVYYRKGIPGFEYRILQTASGTQYIEFMASDLIGTKCTDDQGVFASIMINPSSSDEQTLTATTKVGVDNYGLSLAGSSCTSDTELLAEYQAAFKDGFSSLRELDD